MLSHPPNSTNPGNPKPEKSGLHRVITLPQLVLYGLGTTIGAGIYALTGEVAGAAGYGAPLSFLLASLLAGFTALSFAELSGRFPRAAGAALYVQQGFGIKRMSMMAGLLVASAGMVSAAALINAFVSQAQALIDLPRLTAVLVLCLMITAIAAKGIRESVVTAIVITVVEIAGLLLVVWVSRDGWLHPEVMVRLDTDSWQFSGVFFGALLAFYAFIGFEDMVDVTEEVHQPRRTMPLAIVITLVCVTLLYVLIMLAAVLAVPPDVLAAEKVPLVFLYQHYAGGDGLLLAVIGLLAIINGALIQTVMASRVLYGLASRGQLPARLATINGKTQTPLLATAIAGITLLCLALPGTLTGLAEATSLLMLTVFALVNLSLFRIKRREPLAEGFRVPLWVPALGMISCSGFIAVRAWQWLTLL